LVITKAITNLNEAHTKLNLSQTVDKEFFTEWFDNLPSLIDTEESLNRLKNRYLYGSFIQILLGLVLVFITRTNFSLF
jgi:hypothetical protein